MKNIFEHLNKILSKNYLQLKFNNVFKHLNDFYDTTIAF